MRNYLKYQNRSSLVKYLFKVDKNKNKIVKDKIINEKIKFMEDNNIKQSPENENPNEVANIVEKILNFNEH